MGRCPRRGPAAPAPDPVALANAADALAAAVRPVVIADFAARPPHGWAHVIAIAETLGAPVWDCNSRLNFPSNHTINLSMAPKECYDGADVVLALDIADFEGPTHVRDIATRTVVNMVPETATWIDIGLTDVEVRARPEIIESTFDRVRYGFTTDFPYHILWW